MNKFQVDVDVLMGLKMSVESYMLLWCLRYGKEDLLLDYTRKCYKISTDSLDELVQQEYIKAEKTEDGKYFLSTMSLLQKGIALFPEQTGGPDEWIDQWFDLSTKGVKSGGFYLRTDKNACLKKMEKFCKDHPEYTKGIIIGATKKDLDSVRIKGYEYCKLAPYFISKDGMSVLDGYCADLKNSVGKSEISEEYKEHRL